MVMSSELFRLEFENVLQQKARAECVAVYQAGGVVKGYPVASWEMWESVFLELSDVRMCRPLLEYTFKSHFTESWTQDEDVSNVHSLLTVFTSKISAARSLQDSPHVHLWGHRVHEITTEIQKPKTSRTTLPVMMSSSHTHTHSLTYRHKPEHKTLTAQFFRRTRSLRADQQQTAGQYDNETSDYCTQPWKKRDESRLQTQDQIHRTGTTSSAVQNYSTFSVMNLFIFFFWEWDQR